MRNGSWCAICPLNGQRKVGVAGPVASKVVIMGEAPGATEESWNTARQKYGEPFQGKAGWALKVKLLARAGLASIKARAFGWPSITAIHVWILNVLMCRPPKNKVDSPEGRKAFACCHRSALALLRERERQFGTDSVLVPMGGTALALITGEDAIGPYRGRVMNVDIQDSSLGMSESAIMRSALRGIKPPPEWSEKRQLSDGSVTSHLVAIRSLLNWSRRQLLPTTRRARKSLKPSVKFSLRATRTKRAAKRLSKWLLRYSSSRSR
jgi:uracil-DNA glycosylase family 4